MQCFKNAAAQSAKILFNALPVLVGVILLIGAVSVFVSPSGFARIFSQNIFWDSLLGSALGSVFAGNPITSYILGGEFLKQGIGLIPVTAFLVAWVTVGVLQLPAEIVFFGRRFAFLRNGLSFVFSIAVALTTVLIYSHL
ncbi:permease [Candidatus Gracilibacteria bacterium]|nr:permease [Candidatus Gracilibacteria bacterium]